MHYMQYIYTLRVPCLPAHAFLRSLELLLWYLQEFKFRLDTLSLKLHGVDNLLGHQLAVHEMADILGVAVAQVLLQCQY